MTRRELGDLRRLLDAVDARIVEALGERERLVSEVASVKRGDGEVLRDRAREEELLTRLVDKAAQAGGDRQLVTRVFREVLDHSLRVQHEHLTDRGAAESSAEALVVAYQGTEGSYSHLAASRHFAAHKAEVVLRGHDTFRDILEAVRDGAADYALLPIENTTAGSINASYDLLARMQLSLVGEEVWEVRHCLVALDAVPLSRIRRVYSQIQALEQCSNFLGSLRDCHVESYTDTAMSCQLIREQQDLSHAAIASEEAARLYGLRVIKRDIANQKDNFTRFVIVAREPLRFDLRIPCKTSLVFSTRDERGALLECLNVLAAHGLNLTKLESRPRPNAPWEYLFYVDFEGNVAAPDTEEALRQLAAHTRTLRVLGSYPARTTESARAAEPLSPLARPAPAPEIAAGAASALEEAEREAAIAALDKAPYRLVSRAGRREDTTIRVGNAVLGGPRPVIIAGPCAVESREQIMACAKVIKEAGGDMLRGGCFKPRTSPYAFQGMGFEGLDLLAEAGRAFDLPIVTEVLHPADVEAVAAKAHVLQVGARNMANFALLKEIGRVDRPVMLKRGLMASIDEWLAAAEYILAAGNQQVFLCERGIRTFETATRNTLDLSSVVVAKERTHLPVIVDPSHAAGVRRWVPPMAVASIAVGAHGVMVEIHPDPPSAKSDGPQALTFDMFRDLMVRLAAARAA
jgi:chorismate mutase/prephenate dehydratase